MRLGKSHVDVEFQHIASMVQEGGHHWFMKVSCSMSSPPPSPLPKSYRSERDSFMRALKKCIKLLRRNNLNFLACYPLRREKKTVWSSGKGAHLHWSTAEARLAKATILSLAWLQRIKKMRGGLSDECFFLRTIEVGVPGASMSAAAPKSSSLSYYRKEGTHCQKTIATKVCSYGWEGRHIMKNSVLCYRRNKLSRDVIKRRLRGGVHRQTTLLGRNTVMRQYNKHAWKT